jgi:hypothetical protein
MADVNDVLKHFKSLPRAHLQRELRRIVGDDKFYLWEFIAPVGIMSR